MAVLYITDFEDFTLGDSNGQHGWGDNDGGSTNIVDTRAHSGTKSIYGSAALGSAGGGLGPTGFAPSKRAIYAETWSYWDSSSTSSPMGGGLLFIVDAVGFNGVFVGSTGGDPTMVRLEVAGLPILESDTGVVPADEWYHSRYEVTFSTYTVGTPNADGGAKIWINGTLVLTVENEVVAASGGDNDAWWDQFAVLMEGWIDDIEIGDLVVVGSMVVGVTGTVTAPRAVLFSLNGDTNTNSTPGLFKIAGDLEVTGTASVAGDATPALDALGE